VIVIKNLSARMGNFSIEDVSLDIRKGEYFVVLGPTGSGKTVLLECIAGLNHASGGEIWISGRNVTKRTPEEREASYVPQDYVLFPFLSVRGNVEFGMKVKNYPRDEINLKLNEVADLLGIKNLINRSPQTLSGGEKQRVALARALVIESELLLLDEPLSALDPKTREGVEAELKNVHLKTGTTTIHVTHNFEEAITLADRIGVMHEGKIIQTGTPEEIFRKPESEFVAKFVGAENLFKGTSTISEGISVIDISGVNNIKIYSSTQKEGNVRVTIPPEDILLSREKLMSSARNNFHGKIIEISIKGPLIKVLVDASIKLTVLVTKRSFEESNLNINSDVYVSFKASEVHVF